jgi:hypothetical protein
MSDNYRPRGWSRNDPNYQQAGDWRSSRGNRTAVGEDGVKRRLSDGRAIIKGFRQSQGGRLMGEPSGRPSNMNEFFYRQEGFSPAQARKMSRQLAERGYTKGFGGQGIEPNRGMSDRERAQTGPGQTGGGKGGFKRFRGPTDDQRKWSRKFQESQTPRTTSAPSTVDDTPGAASAKARESFLQRYKMAPPPASGPAPAPNFSRSALVQGAKKSGDFARVRDQYNTAAVGTGNRMDKMGSIAPLSKTGGGPDGTSAFAQDKFGAAAEDIRARRDFARRDALQETSSRQGGLVPSSAGGRPSLSSDYSASFSSKYGSGSGTAGKTSGAMTDPLTGKTVPMKGYLAGQSAVQDTKEPGSTSGESYYDPKKIRSSMKKGKA